MPIGKVSILVLTLVGLANMLACKDRDKQQTEGSKAVASTPSPTQQSEGTPDADDVGEGAKPVRDHMRDLERVVRRRPRPVRLNPPHLPDGDFGQKVGFSGKNRLNFHSTPRPPHPRAASGFIERAPQRSVSVPTALVWARLR
jgi:hypothetical protein